MKKEELLNRTKKFAHNCIKITAKLPNNTLGRHICGQLVRSSTSVAANYRATCIAQSTKSFVAKLSIVIEEIDESFFWLEFIQDENLINSVELEEIKNEASQLTSIFIASRKTISNKLNISNNKYEIKNIKS